MTEPTQHADAVRPVCPYCVQWRCAGCKSMDWPTCCPEAQITADAEPIWADGTVATLTQDEACPTCARAINEYVGWEHSGGQPMVEVTPELLQKLRRFVQGDDSVEFSPEEDHWLREDGWRYLTIASIGGLDGGDD